MARKAENKWEKRSTDLMKRLEKQSETTIQELVRVYNRAEDNIQKEIEKIFNQYAKNGKLKKEVAERLLTKKEQSVYYNNLLKTIGLIKDKEIQRKLLAKYNAPAYQARITRLQALQENIYVEVKKLAEVEKQVTKRQYERTIEEAYYRNMYEIQHGLGVGFSFAQMDTKTIELMLAKDWIGKKNFSKRIWKNSDVLANFLREDLMANMMSGASVQKMARSLNDTMNLGLYNATRLVRTEVNHFANEAEMLSYEEAGIEEYQFVATLDKVTCKRCAKLDKRILKVKNRKPGKNYPPIHANDRCTTVAVFDENKTKGDLQRRAKDNEGNRIKVPQGMDYEHWNSNIKDNFKKEEEEYTKYKGILKKNMPDTFAKFLNLKYNDVSKWKELQINFLDTKGMTTVKEARKYQGLVEKKVHEGREGKHYVGHNNYIPGKSCLTITMEEVQKLIDKYAGKGKLNFDKAGKWDKTETIKTNRVIGFLVKENVIIKTKKFKIHYSKDGLHIVPYKKGV